MTRTEGETVADPKEAPVDKTAVDQSTGAVDTGSDAGGNDSATDSAPDAAATAPTAEPDGAVDTRRTPARVVRGLVRTARPKQWVKNVLVLAVPFLAFKNNTDHAHLLVATVIAFVAFCLAASAIYLINDAKDVEADRAHPTKRNRPIAAGIVPVPLALGTAVVLLVAALSVSFAASWQLAVVIGVYAAVQLGYCFGWKHQPVIDLCIVASGFLLRSIAGGVASDLSMSEWFLLVTAFGSLFMVSGKRYAEIRLFEETGAEIRASLRNYSASYLRFVWATSVAIMITTYGLWAFQLHQQSDSVWSIISMVPFVIAVLRYAVDVDGGKAGAPDEIVLRDRVLQVLGVCWALTLGLAFYL